MNRSFLRTAAKMLAGLVAMAAVATIPAGCAQKKCGGCTTSKGCPHGCSKPCCKKAGETKPCDAKPAEKK